MIRMRQTICLIWEKQLVNPLQPSFLFYLETSHLICTGNQVTGFFMKCNAGLKWIKEPTCFKSGKVSLIDTLETNKPNRLQKTDSLVTGVSDCHTLL